MSYVQANLTSNEKILHQCKISKWYLLPNCIVAALVVLLGDEIGGTAGGMISGLSLYVVGSGLLYYYTTELALTNKRVIAKNGYFKPDISEIHISHLEAVTVNQGMFGSMFKFGNIMALGERGSTERIGGIDDPLTFRKLGLDASKRARG